MGRPRISAGRSLIGELETQRESQEGRRRSLCCPVKVVAKLNCVTALDTISEELLKSFRETPVAYRLRVDVMRPAARAKAAVTGEESASSGKGTGSGGSGTCAAETVRTTRNRATYRICIRRRDRRRLP